MKSPKRIVLVGGCFDIVHIGHISFLRSARALGDWLVVALESDKHIRDRKCREPVQSQHVRKRILEELRSVDEVIALPDVPDYRHLVRDVAPTVIAVTEGDPNMTKKEALAKQYAAQVITIPKTPTRSTTEILSSVALRP